MIAAHIAQMVALACGLAYLGLSGHVGTRPEELAQDEATLKSAGFASTGPDLVRFFRARTLSDADLDRLRTCVKQLGDKSYQVRQKAQKDLITAGPLVTPLLKEALGDADLEVASRVKRCLERLSLQNDTPLALAALRLIAARKPDGAMHALLAHAPFVADIEVEDTLVTTLAAISLRGTKNDRTAADIIVQALTEKAPASRAAATAVVARAGLPQRRLAHAALKDPDARVRWRAAEGLFVARDDRTISALIALLDDAPLKIAWQAEELLWRIAGDKAPTLGVGEGAAGVRGKVRLAWDDWYKN